MGPRDNEARTAGLKRERGGFQFEKHYFGCKPGELPEATPNGDLTENFKCAQFLDGMPGRA